MQLYFILNKMRHGVLTGLMLTVVIGVFIVGSAFSGQRYQPASVGKLPNHSQLRMYQTEAMLDKGKFLVASRSLIDPNFSQTVILLLEYVRNGAMGVVINRPTEMKLSQVLPDLEELKKRPDILYLGGPVSINQMLLLVQSPDKPENAVQVFKDVFITPSTKVLQRLVERADKNERFRVYAGYAGWAPGQLDQEVARGDWYVFQADAESVFDKEPSNVWHEFIRRGSTKYVSVDKAGMLGGFR